MQQRKYTRVQYHNEVEVQYRGMVRRTRSKDLSLRGIRILRPEDLDIPSESTVILSFTDSGRTAEVEGRLSFCDDLEWGVVFTHIGENSLQNLIRSMERAGRASGDADSILKEVKQMVLRVAD